MHTNIHSSTLTRYKRTQASQTSQALRLKGGSWLENVKNALFPIEGWEMPKFFSMSCMMFMIIYIYTTVRDTKDTLVVSACGAESITFLKVCRSLLQCTHAHIHIFESQVQICVRITITPPPSRVWVHICTHIRVHALPFCLRTHTTYSRTARTHTHTQTHTHTHTGIRSAASCDVVHGAVFQDVVHLLQGPALLRDVAALLRLLHPLCLCALPQPPHHPPPHAP